jgi:hypothetical protein
MAKPEMKSEADAFREAFHQRMHANNMYGLWELASQMTAHPQPKMVPHMWPWSTTESIIEEWARAVPVGDDEQSDRRGADSFARRSRARTATRRPRSASLSRAPVPTPPSTASASTWRLEI